ncbi:hypothetical protein KC19_12G156600 [Ceratodon purpureus]|uniref:Uncharacterized protein n=1 Tax=Ceratodon purpureus TaxID=3225 RepID=A0A8T0GBB3_CERPU|nr:hypothetical protein KC19_12G156600 [Ceratodon purpureus]
MYSRKGNQTVGDQGTAAYTNVPAGAGIGGTANYPSGQKVSSQKVGYGYDAGKDVNSGTTYPSSQKAGYGVHDSNVVHPQQSNGYGGGYVQQTPVSYGPDGTPVAYPVKKNHRLRNVVVGALAVCCCCIAL